MVTGRPYEDQVMERIVEEFGALYEVIDAHTGKVISQRSIIPGVELVSATIEGDYPLSQLRLVFRDTLRGATLEERLPIWEADGSPFEHDPDLFASLIVANIQEKFEAEPPGQAGSGNR